MKRTRYFIAECPGGQIPGMIRRCSNYHYVWLDDGTIFGMGDFEPGQLSQAEDSDEVSCLSLHDAAPLRTAPGGVAFRDVNQQRTPKQEQKRHRHLTRLQAHGVVENDSGVDIVAKIYQRFKHPLLLPDS